MSRFQAIGNYVYEKGERIGCTPEEAADAVACKLNAYQMRIERLKAEVERLRKAGDAMHRAIKVSDPFLDWAIECWNAAKEGKPSV